ncbi:LLM class flavin-dependent oxidoreductase [Frondihabitans cladoniiphilus]|uniref:Luciferase-like domain-containing protein n=1 Tax=Frondihabitans cladoniiphilus TaxID=715785 RepID=A0ABP8W4Z3_9MICO
MTPRGPVVGWAVAAETSALLVSEVRALDAARVDLAIVPVTGLGAADPAVVLAAVAPLTSHIGLVAGQSPWQQPPFLAARGLATLDAVSRGRAGWFVQPEVTVSTVTDDSGRWFPSPDDSPEVRAAALADLYAATLALWDSWEPDAIVADVPAGQYVDDEKVHVVDHVGPYYSTRGPLNLPRTPQGRPLVVSAVPTGGTPPVAGDVVVLSTSVAEAPAEVARIRAAAASPDTSGAAAPLVLLAVRPLVDAAADDRTRPYPTLAGSAAQVVADVLALLETSGADGIVVVDVPKGAPTGAVLHGVLPELGAGHGADPRILRTRLGLAPVPSVNTPVPADGTTPVGTPVLEVAP